jgi:subtilisin family serine protease
MNIILILVAFLPRPDIAEVGPADLAVACERAAELASAPLSSVNVDALFDAPDRVPGRFTVGFEPGCEEAARRWIERNGGLVRGADSGDAGFLVAEFGPTDAGRDARLLSSARGQAGIRYLEPELRVVAAALPNDPLFLSNQWDKWVMYADQAWDIAGGTMDVKVAVVDNGTDYTHPDLAANFKQGELGRDIVGNDDDPRPDDPSVPEAFHGTHVAGIIAATRNNGIGIAGWSLAQLVAVRVLNDSGAGNTSDLALGIRWAVDHGCRIVNMSLGASAAPTDVIEACQYAASLNVLLIAATGNEAKLGVNFPAALSECVAVGAVSPESRIAPFSNYGPEVELAAPGVSIASTVPGGEYALADGTSMATPEVSGVAALVLAVDYSLNAAGVRAVLSTSAIDMGPAGRDQNYGYGLVNAKRALDLAAALGRKSLGAPGQRPRAVTLTRGDLVLPGWVESAEVFDGAGRLARATAGSVRLSRGAWFVRLEGAGRQDNLKVLVLD